MLGLAVLSVVWVTNVRVDGMRQVKKLHGNATLNVSVGLQAGMLFAGQWQLVKKLSSEDQFPNQIKAWLTRWSDGMMLGRGSFGETWQACGSVDGSSPPKTVALKIFYRKERKGIVYLTNGNLKDNEKDEIGKVQEECNVVEKIKAKARERNDIAQYRFAGCFRVEKGLGDNDPIYAILELGGDSLDNLVGQVKPEEARKIIGHLLQALKFMGESMDPPLIHHDLKPANAVYDRESGIARLIDFGGVMEATKRTQCARAVRTPFFAPPESAESIICHGNELAFDFPAYSFDMYALGMIYAALMCPNLKKEQLWDWAHSKSALLCDLGGDDLKWMNEMVKSDPNQRPFPSIVLKHGPFRGISIDQIPARDAKRCARGYGNPIQSRSSSMPPRANSHGEGSVGRGRGNSGPAGRGRARSNGKGPGGSAGGRHRSSGGGGRDQSKGGARDQYDMIKIRDQYNNGYKAGNYQKGTYQPSGGGSEAHLSGGGDKRNSYKGPGKNFGGLGKGPIGGLGTGPIRGASEPIRGQGAQPVVEKRFSYDTPHHANTWGLLRS